MFDKLTLEELRTIHGLLFDAIDANKKLIQALMQTEAYSLTYVKHLVNINGSLMNLDEDVCIRITELQ